MKKLAVVILMLCSALALTGAETKPADYNVYIHVTSSRLTDINWLRLSVIIDGKKYELQGTLATQALLVPGDYKARLVKDEHKTAYDSNQVYEFLFPDKKTRQYHVIGVME